MRKLILLASAFGFGLFAHAQNIRPVERAPERISVEQTDVQEGISRHFQSKHQQQSAENVIFSEDFASGIPAGWTNTGTAAGVPDPDAVWEYRGATGTQPATVGSRGAYANPAFTILSPTAANGFVIFDSDFLDNAGTQGNFGGGIAPSPHNAGLVTSTIDLTGQSNVILTFYQYYRVYLGPGGAVAPTSYVDISTDNGATWSTTYTLNSGVSVNSSTSRDDLVYLDISAAAAGASQTKIRFRFNGDYYFWMIDDITISGPANYDFDVVGLDGYSGVDWIIGDGSKMGINTRAQPQSWVFLSSIYNRGVQDLNNVQLEVGILKDNAPYRTLMSPVYSSLSSGDTLDYFFLNTLADQFVPTELGTYTFYFQINSDSITLNTDTTFMFITNSLMSLDYNYWYNSVGTSLAIGEDSCKIASRIDFEGDDYLEGVQIGLGSTQGGAQVVVEVYDSAAFTGFVTGFNVAGRLDSIGPLNIDPSEAFQGRKTIFFNEPIYLDENHRSVYIIVTMYRNGYEVNLRNDQTVDASFLSSLMYYPGLQWYTGFLGSRSFESPWIRAITSEGVCDYDMLVDSIVAVNANKGIYRAFFDTLAGSDWRLEIKAAEDTVWRTKSIAGPNQGQQLFNIGGAFGTTLEVRLAIEVNGVWETGCSSAVEVPCKPFNMAIVVQQTPFCAGDSSLVRVGYSGGFGVPEILWSNGATTKRTFGQQGETLTVTVTDAAGCSYNDTIVIPALNLNGTPSNFSVTKPSPTSFRGTWTAAILEPGHLLIGYRMAYRLRGTSNWTTTALTTDTFAVVDFTGSGRPAGNYEFVAFARYNNGSSNTNSEYTCKAVRGYNGSGNKTDVTEAGSDNDFFIMYPNPANSKVSIQAERNATIVITDMRSNIIGTYEVQSSEVMIDLSSFASGVYLVRVNDSNGSHTQQLVKY